MSIEFWVIFEPQNRPTRSTLSFLFIIVGAERKILLCVKLFDFFSGWILILLTWNMSHFFPNSVEILTWNFRKKTISGEFFRNFVQTKGILYQNLWNFVLLSAILFWLRSALKKFTQVLLYVICTQVRRHANKKIRKRRYGEKMPGRFIFGKPILFTLGPGLTTPYSLSILVFNFYQTFVTMSIEFWQIFEPQNRPTRSTLSFLFIIIGAERKILWCLRLFDFLVGEYSSFWPEICCVFSQIQWIFLRGIPGKNYFGGIFQKFCANQGSTKTCEISSYFLQFYSDSVVHWKN